MIPITETKDDLALLINDIVRKHMLDTIDPDLRKKLSDTKGDIVFDFKNNTFIVKANDEELKNAIVEDWKSKR
ncbi:hypothetical protein ACEN9X_05115 [Mucilaginibacter sp. Mucisp86]|uniref:hypothetical protein n=1 Tax=Mucilaginibacter sp. Mucisp86 TaxID=3243060 RepID=UPI0039B3CC6A